MAEDKNQGVLCGDARRLLDLLAEELFPERQSRVTGSAVLNRVRELVVDAGRLEAAIEMHRYAPPRLDERTGEARSAVDRAIRMTVEHTALVDRWTKAELELASSAPPRPRAVGEGGA